MTIRRAGIAAVATIALLGVSACGSDEPESEPTSAASEPSEEATADAPAATEGSPAWAKPFTTPGEKIATVEAGDVTVDVYQVGTAKATKTGNFVDPEKNEPIIDEGDEIVFVNYVVTNNGDPIDLGSSLVDVESRYVDWPYLQGMDGITDSALYEEQDVQTLGVSEIADPAVYTLGKGETFAYGENFRYEKGTELEIEVRYTPVDAEGELLHDDRVEGEGKGTIS